MFIYTINGQQSYVVGCGNDKLACSTVVWF